MCVCVYICPSGLSTHMHSRYDLGARIVSLRITHIELNSQSYLLQIDISTFFQKGEIDPIKLPNQIETTKTFYLRTC